MAGPRQRAYVGLGSNLDDPEAQVRRALHELGALAHTRMAGASRLYRNPPMGPAEQPEYVNAAAALDTALGPYELLRALQALEHAHGRTRQGPRWGPRTLDLDLLLYGDRVQADPALVLPHPGIAQRVFVLRPLYELAPDLHIPDLGGIRALLEALPEHELRALEEAP